jgi:Family of unknown function (DUF6441)
MTRVQASVVGDLERELVAEAKGAERAVTAAIRLAGAGVKAGWRAQIAGAGLGERLGRTIRDQYYPKGGTSISAAALVYSRASHIVGAHDQGATIRSKDGFWLSIPTEAAGKGARGGRITPGEWERRTGIRLRFVYRRGRPSLLVADQARINTRGLAKQSRSKAGRGQVSAVIFLLVPQVRLTKRLDLDAVTQEWRDRLPALVVQNWPDIKAETY